MTDANLMDAPCIHGVHWYDCEACEWEQAVMDDQASDDDWQADT